MTDLSPLNGTTELDMERSKEMAAAISRALRRAARQARQPTSLIIGGGVPARRGDRAFRIGVVASFIAFVFAPTLLAGVYWGWIASPQYDSEAKFILRSSDSSALDSFGGLMGLPTSRQTHDSEIVVSYIESPALLRDLSKTIDLVKAYSNPSIDYLSRLSPSPPIEKFDKYFQRHIDVGFESGAGILTVNVRAFTPQDSEKIANEVVRLSENMVNDLADRPRRDALAQAKLELTRAEEGLRDTTLAMRDARNSEGVLDANATAEAIGNVVTTLRLKLVEMQSALATLESQAQDAPQARVYKARIDNLKQAIDGFNGQIAENNNSQSLADRLSTLSVVQTELDVARQRYAGAAAVYQAARLDMETQRTYIVAFLQPILAQKATYPHRWTQWLIVAVPSLLLWSFAVGLFMVARNNMAK